MTSNFLNEMKTTYRLSDIWSESLQILPSIIQDYEQIPLVSLEESIQPIKSLIPDIERMIWIVKQHCQQIENDLTFNESASIMLYSMEWLPIEKSFYYLFKQTLCLNNRDLFKPWLLYFKLLLISYLKISNENHSIVYHGIEMNLSTKYFKGKNCIWWGFLSCTTSKEYLSNFLNKKSIKTLFKIECQTGKDIHQHTFYPEQKEILFLPGRQFQIINNYQENKYLYIIHLKEIQPYISFPKYISSIYTITKKKYSICEYINPKLEYFIDHFKSHNEIKLFKLKLNDNDMEIVGKQAINNKNCTELLLNDNQITCKGILILASKLYNNTKLKKLVLANNFIGDLGVKYLSELLAANHTNLKILDISSNNITDKGIYYISDMLKTNKFLTSLWLNGNEITDNGVQYLMNSLISFNTILKFLRLSSDQTISDTSIDSIINMLKNNQTLTYLDIQRCNISLNGKKLIEDTVKLKKNFFLNI